jgi:hypothetical protein
MTLEEAEKLAKVFETADSGCKSCVEGICEEANSMNMGFIWEVPDDDNWYSGGRQVMVRKART